LTALAVTAHAKAEDRARALAAGYKAHVAKPVDPAELVLMLASLVRIRAAGTHKGNEHESLKALADTITRRRAVVTDRER